MALERAVEADVRAVVELANAAYRGARGWCSESGLIEGDRLTEEQLREDVRAKPEARLLLWRREEGGAVEGTVWLEPMGGGTWYLGLLTVWPELQDRGLGRQLLEAAERSVRECGGRRVRMSVVHVRETLIAWYRRRGYQLTGERAPFLYGDARFGVPTVEGLEFALLEKELEGGE